MNDITLLCVILFYFIFSGRYLPPSTQVVLISATMPQEVLDMTKKFMNMPVKILVKRDELTLEGIKQVCIHVLEGNKTVESFVDTTWACC